MKASIRTLTTSLIAAASMSSATAWAGKDMTLSCSITSSGNTVGTKPVLRSGMIESVPCDRLACPDAKDWDVKMNYNGNGYEYVTVEITHLPTGQHARSVHDRLTVGSSIEAGAASLRKNGQANYYLSINCDVSAVTPDAPKPAASQPAASAARN